MKFFVVIFCLSGIFWLTSCGGTSSNPAQNYSNLKTIPEDTEVKLADQKYAPSPFEIEVIGQNDINFWNFSEGELGEVRFNVRPLDQISDYTLMGVNLPEGATLTRSENNIWVLKWTPPAGTVLPQFLSQSRSIQIIARVLKTDDPALRNLVTQPAPFKITIGRTHQLPIILGVSGFKDSVGEGDNFVFTIDVKDPTQATLPPEIAFSPYDDGSNRENYKADGSVLIQPSSQNPPQTLGGGVWRRSYIFVTEGKPLPLPIDVKGKLDAQANHLHTCFTLKAVSAFGNQSLSKSLCNNITYALQPPKLTDLSPLAFNSGSLQTADFTLSSPNGHGVVQVQNETPRFTFWQGKPQLSCAPGENLSSQKCRINWNVPCFARPFDRILTVRATNQLAQNTKGVTYRIHVLATPNPKGCTK